MDFSIMSILIIQEFEKDDKAADKSDVYSGAK